jgi:hypothetical protein
MSGRRLSGSRRHNLTKRKKIREERGDGRNVVDVNIEETDTPPQPRWRKKCCLCENTDLCVKVVLHKVPENDVQLWRKKVSWKIKRGSYVCCMHFGPDHPRGRSTHRIVNATTDFPES